MTLIQLVDMVSGRTGIPRTKVKKIIQEFLELTKELTSEGVAVKLQDFGRFERYTLRPMMAFGKMTKERTTLRFKPYGERHGKVRRRSG